MFIIALWLLFSFLVAGLGSERKITGIGAFFISLIFSPLIGLIVVLVSDKKPLIYKCTYCEYRRDLRKATSPFCPQCGRNKEGKTQEFYR